MFSKLRARCAVAGLAVVILVGWAQVGAGIIELGKKSHTATGSKFYAIVDGRTFSDANHVVGDTAENIMNRIRANIDVDPIYTAVAVSDPDPNRNAIRVLYQGSGTEVNSLGIFEDDATVIGGASEANPPSLAAPIFILGGVDAVDANGDVTLTVTLDSASPPPFVVSTLLKTAAQVNADLRAALQAAGFIVAGPPDGPWNVIKPGKRFLRVAFTHTDTGVNNTAVTLDFRGGRQSVPALSTWGMIMLAVLLISGAAMVLRRRQAAAAR